MQLTLNRTTINILAEIQRINKRINKASDEELASIETRENLLFAQIETKENLLLILLEHCLGREVDPSTDEDDANMNELLALIELL